MNAYDQFPPGTRVRVVESELIDQEADGSDADQVAGMTGTVVAGGDISSLLDGYVSVEFDDPVPDEQGHDCDGEAEMGHGWNVMVKYLMPITPITPEYLAWCAYDQQEEP